MTRLAVGADLSDGLQVRDDPSSNCTPGRVPAPTERERRPCT